MSHHDRRPTGDTQRPGRLSRLQRRILTWLYAKHRRTRGTTAPGHHELVQALTADKGNLSHSLHNLEGKGLITVGRTPGGKAEYLVLTAEGLKYSAKLAGSCD